MSDVGFSQTGLMPHLPPFLVALLSVIFRKERCGKQTYLCHTRRACTDAVIPTLFLFPFIVRDTMDVIALTPIGTRRARAREQRT